MKEKQRQRDTEKKVSSKYEGKTGDFQRMKACRRGTGGRRKHQIPRDHCTRERSRCAEVRRPRG